MPVGYGSSRRTGRGIRSAVEERSPKAPLCEGDEHESEERDDQPATRLRGDRVGEHAERSELDCPTRANRNRTIPTMRRPIRSAAFASSPVVPGTSDRGSGSCRLPASVVSRVSAGSSRLGRRVIGPRPPLAGEPHRRRLIKRVSQANQPALTARRPRAVPRPDGRTPEPRLAGRRSRPEERPVVTRVYWMWPSRRSCSAS